MMTLKEQISKDFMEAFKSKNMDKKNFLGVVKGEIQNEESRKGDVTDDTVMTIIKKMEKSLKQTNTDESLKELEYIKPYLPTLMGEDRIREILTTYKVNGIDNIGKMMGEFNKNFKGMADNGLVSKIVKEVLI
tara:strand:+ start:414 stop:812 length:399 start_codon:yes stop_codon:yes gene_type:complete